MKLDYVVPEAPKFATLAEERQHIRQRLAAAFRLFSKFGFDEGVAGHITARDPEHASCFWVNPFGVHFSQITASNLSLVSETGEILEGRPINAAAFAIHSAIHAARPDVIAAAHSHSLHGKTWSTLVRLLDPLTQDACAFFQDHVIFDEYNGVVLDTSEGERIAQVLGQRKAVIMRNHGNLTVGQSVDEAAWWFITMERSCQAQLMAEAVGRPRVIDDTNALLTRSQTGTHYAGWFQFQPLYQRIVKEQPDLLN